MSSSQIVPMSALETELIDAVFCGEWAGTAELPTSLSASQQTDRTVEGAFLRKLLLGLISPPATAGHNPRMHGVRLQGAIIKGEIDLSGCTGMKGIPLPPLLLKRCIIRGRLSKEKPVVCSGAKVPEKILSVINASNARLNRLSLRECRINGRVDLTDATLDGDLDISDLEPVSSDCYCQISLRRCRIDGSVIAQGARLRIPDDQRTEFDLPDYALNLVSAEVYGSVWLQPDFHAHGGVSVRGAHINGSIWAHGAEFVAASSKIAFRAESLRCDGSVSLCGTETGQQCILEGKLSFLAATIDYLDLRGIHIKSPKESAPDQGFILDLNLAHVRRDVQLYDITKECKIICKAIVDGPIDARGMTLGGDLRLIGPKIKLPPKGKKWAIFASNLRIGGDVILYSFNSSIDLTGSHVEHNLDIEKSDMVSPIDSEYGLQAHNITIGNDCNLKAMSGTINLELSRIGGELKVYADNLAALNAKEAEVRGSVTISGKFRPSEEYFLCFDGGNYRGGFYIGDNESLKIIQSPTKCPRRNFKFSIDNACIENKFLVKKVEAEIEEGTEVIVSLRGLKARVFHYAAEESWDAGIKLRLDGFEYDRIDPESFRIPAQINLEFKTNWCELFTERLRRLFRSSAAPTDKTIRAHQYWLSLQEKYGTAEGYEPQPYEQLARALRNDGRFEDAKHITFLKLSFERRLMSRGLTWLVFGIMEKCFDYGLFPCKSVALFFGLWMAGTAFFYTANNQPIIINIPLFFEEKLDEKPIVFGPDRPILVLHSPAVSTVILPDTVEADGPPMGMERASKSDDITLEEYDEVVFERSCGDEVDPLWYALDVFVPLLDLMQEDKCSITMREDGWWWRVISNIYEILGAIVTPIMLLSVSGLLRRYVED